MEYRKFGALTSSTDPNQLADTVKGAILALSTTIIFVAGLIGMPLANSQIAELATQAGYAISALWFFYGIIKKFVAFFSRE